MILNDLLCADTPVIVQGATGRTARRQIAVMKEYGTCIVAGVSPGRRSGPDDEVEIYPTCRGAVDATGAVTAIQFVPASTVADAACDALESGIKLLVTVTEGVPVHDCARIRRKAIDSGAVWIGPSTPGIAVPGVIKLGFMPEIALARGSVGVMSKSGTLAYEVCYRLVCEGLGQSSWIGVGGDPVKGTRFAELLDYFTTDPNTESVVVVGEIGGAEEEELAAALSDSAFDKPCHCLIAGASAPAGKTLGHAGALVHGHHGSFAAKVTALEGAGAVVHRNIDSMVSVITT
ncbi:MAG TPA: succinate--CoA ligase subunit alpha [Gammaproteobacteria bacterium]|nr:succinate--CoA ligase subunit alpha [Gammaproteobacteria bacterium]